MGERTLRSRPGTSPPGLTTPSVAVPASTRADTAVISSVSMRRSTDGNSFVNAAHTSISALSGYSASMHQRDRRLEARRHACRQTTEPVDLREDAPGGGEHRLSLLREPRHLVERSQSDRPRCDSRFAIEVLMADCTRWSFLAAAEKLPSSTTVTRARSWSSVTGSNIRRPSPRADDRRQCFADSRDAQPDATRLQEAPRRAGAAPPADLTRAREGTCRLHQRVPRSAPSEIFRLTPERVAQGEVRVVPGLGVARDLGVPRGVVQAGLGMRHLGSPSSSSSSRADWRKRSTSALAFAGSDSQHRCSDLPPKPPTLLIFPSPAPGIGCATRARAPRSRALVAPSAVRRSAEPQGGEPGARRERRHAPASPRRALRRAQRRRGLSRLCTRAFGAARALGRRPLLRRADPPPYRERRGVRRAEARRHARERTRAPEPRESRRLRLSRRARLLPDASRPTVALRAVHLPRAARRAPKPR